MSDLLARHRAVIPNWVGLYYNEPIEIVSGKGCRVTDSQGHTYLDFFAGILTNMLGYDVAEVREAVERQLATGIYHTSTLYLIRSQVELAEKIAKLSGIENAKVFFTNSGSEANETALAAALTARKANQILAMRNSYHGRTFGTVAITGNAAWKATSNDPFGTHYVHGTDKTLPQFRNLSDAEYIDACVADLQGAPAGRDQPRGRRRADRRADPGRRRVHDGARRPVQGVQGSPRRARHPAHLRRGADRLGPHRRALLGHPGARRHPRLHDVRQGPRQRVRDRRRGRPGRPARRHPRQRRLHLRRQPDLDHRRQRHPRLRALATTCRPTRRPAARSSSPASRKPPTSSRPSPTCAARASCSPSTWPTPPPARPARKLAAQALEATKERGLLVGKGGLHGATLRMAPPLTLTQDEAREGLGLLVDALRAVNAGAGA